MFDRLFHADWSVDPGKRWVAWAARTGREWDVSEPRLLGPVEPFMNDLAEYKSTLAGFDFPIGLPAAFGRQTGFAGFRAALPALETGEWSRIFDVCDTPDEISLHRPFYPRRSLKGSTRESLIRGLGVEGFDDLLRECERASPGQQAACSLFWTLGGNQVGKGAITGWREVIGPGLDRGAALWPFDGTLAELSAGGGLVLAETYPAIAYEPVGAGFRAGESKRRQSDRAGKAAAILAHAERNQLRLSATALAMIRNGFDHRPRGEDAFDALLGLLLMIEVVEGRRPEMSARSSSPEWEGWILGR